MFVMFFLCKEHIAGTSSEMTRRQSRHVISKEKKGGHKPEGPKPEGHWQATQHFFGKIIMNILYQNLDLSGGLQGEPPLPGPCTPSFKIQIFAYDFPQHVFFWKSARLPSSGQTCVKFATPLAKAFIFTSLCMFMFSKLGFLHVC